MLQGDQKAAEPPKSDPCLPLLDLYTACVAAHTRGLSEGDDCGKEAATYKDCRKQEKFKKKLNNKDGKTA